MFPKGHPSDPAGGPSDPPALGAPGLAFGAPAGASAWGGLGPFCALRVWQKFFHFQFETGFPRVAFIFLGTKSGAPSFALEKSCLPCKPLFGRPKCIININEFSTLWFWSARNREVPCSSTFSNDLGLPKRGLQGKQGFPSAKLVAPHLGSEILHVTVVSPTSN